MNNQKEKNNKSRAASLMLGLLTFIVGGMMIIDGIRANKTGQIIPETWKHGPMSGTDSIVIGALFIVVGLIFIIYEVFHKIKRQ